MIERQLAEGAAAIERASHQAVLRGLDVDQPRVVIKGKKYGRVGRGDDSHITTPAQGGPGGGLKACSV